MARQAPPTKSGNPQAGEREVWDVELLRVLVSRTGKQVSAEWAIHPQIKLDLQPEERQEVTDLMAKVTSIVGKRFSRILSEVRPDPPGNA